MAHNWPPNATGMVDTRELPDLSVEVPLQVLLAANHHRRSRSKVHSVTRSDKAEKRNNKL